MTATAQLGNAPQHVVRRTDTRGELPVSAKTLEAVKATLVQGPDTVASTRDGIHMGGPWKDGAVLSAKTGTYPHADGDTTWLVGYVASPRGRHVFVSVVQAPAGRRVTPHPALASAIAVLKARGLLHIGNDLQSERGSPQRSPLRHWKLPHHQRPHVN